MSSLELLVLAVDGDRHPVAEVLGLAERSALELAAGLGARAVEPEGEADAVVEQQLDRAADERIAGKLGRLVGADRAVAEERAQIGLVRRSLGDGDLLALEPFGGDVEAAGGALGRKAGGRVVVAVGEIDGLERVGAHRVRGDDGVGLAAPERRQQFRPGPHLDVAGRRQLQADGAGDIDVEAGEDIVLVVVVEGRVVAVGEEADGDAPRQRLRLAGSSARRWLRLLRLRGRARDARRRHARRPTKSRTTTLRFVCNMLIRVRPFRAAARWPWGTEGGGLPATAVGARRFPRAY